MEKRKTHDAISQTLQAIFSFTREDLEANRVGMMSHPQRRLLEMDIKASEPYFRFNPDAKIFPSLIATFLGIVCFIYWLALLPHDNAAIACVFAGLTALAIYSLAKFYQGGTPLTQKAPTILEKQLGANSIVAYRNLINPTYFPRNNKPFWGLTIDDKLYGVSEYQYQQLLDLQENLPNQPYSFYIAPHTRKIMSAEPVSLDADDFFIAEEA